MRSFVGPVIFLCAAAPAGSQVGALQTDCRLGGAQDDGGYQFVATCVGRARSPDGRFVIVQRAYRERQPPIELQDARGRTLARLRGLSNDMPFSVMWAPNSRLFFVNHHVGSFMARLRVFEIAGRAAVERPALGNSAVRIAGRRYPCVPPGWFVPTGVRWARDSRRIVLVTISAAYACHPDFRARPGEWWPLWMIGDVRTGLVESRSIRVQADDQSLQMPRDGPYSGF